MPVAAMAMAAKKFLMLRVEACGDAPPVLDAAEHPFDDVALLVDGLIIIVLVFAVLALWDDGWAQRSARHSRKALLS